MCFKNSKDIMSLCYRAICLQPLRLRFAGLIVFICIMICMMFLVNACGGGDSRGNTTLDDNSSLSNGWGMDDDVDSTFVYLKGNNPEARKVKLDRLDQDIKIHDDYNEILAKYDKESGKYLFDTKYRGTLINCSADISSDLGRVDMRCHFNSLEKGLANDLWIGTDSHGVFHLDSNGRLAKQDFFWEEGLNDGSIKSILVESYQKIWFGTDWDGLYLWNAQENNFKRFLNERCCESVNDMYLDENGIVWLAAGSGVYFIDGNYVVHKILAESNIKNITRDRLGRFWFSQGNVGNKRGFYLMIIKK